jgi:hypothetical protein
MAGPSQPRAQACLSCACDFNRLPAHIFAVELEKVESADVRGHGAHERPELAGDEENGAAYTNIEAVRTEIVEFALPPSWLPLPFFGDDETSLRHPQRKRPYRLPLIRPDAICQTTGGEPPIFSVSVGLGSAPGSHREASLAEFGRARRV